MKAAVCWSGGKDSCLAAYRAGALGIRVVSLLTMVSREHHRSFAHGLASELLQAQADSLGLPLLTPSYGQDDYEEVFKEALRGLKQQGVEAVVTGDIHLNDSREWTERVCGEVGLKLVAPLWGRDPWDILREFLGLGFEAVVVSLDSKALDPKWLGRRLDGDFLAYLQAQSQVDPCGERGEFHTLVLSGPPFKKRIQLGETRGILRDGHWFLDILGYQLLPREASGKWWG